MRNPTINQIIDDFTHLPLGEKEYAVQVIKKQLVEAKRERIVKRAKAAMSNLNVKRVKSGTLKDLFKDLESE